MTRSRFERKEEAMGTTYLHAVASLDGYIMILDLWDRLTNGTAEKALTRSQERRGEAWPN
jgi:hypothetical protein